MEGPFSLMRKKYNLTITSYTKKYSLNYKTLNKKIYVQTTTASVFVSQINLCACQIYGKERWWLVQDCNSTPALILYLQKDLTIHFLSMKRWWGLFLYSKLMPHDYISGWELIDFVSHERSKPKLVTSLSLIIP